jgi:hypothetical protein
MNAIRCSQSIFVDKQDVQTSDTIRCPLPRCNYTWCKICHQEVNNTGPRHSCDGSSELNHLMDSRGWKYCPSGPSLFAQKLQNIQTYFLACHTAIEKSSGCNHMTVGFVYLCRNFTYLINILSAYLADAIPISVMFAERLSFNPSYHLLLVPQSPPTSVNAECEPMLRNTLKQLDIFLGILSPLPPKVRRRRQKPLGYIGNTWYGAAKLVSD